MMRGAIFQWFCIELQRILLRRGHGKDFEQLSSIQTMEQEGELTDGGDSLRWCGSILNI